MVYRQKGESQKLRLQENKAQQNQLLCDSFFCLITGNICSVLLLAIYVKMPLMLYLKKIQIEWESHLIPSLSVTLFNIL